MTETRFEKTGKTTYKQFKQKVKEIDQKTYDNIVSDDTLKWFRRLGGSETAVKGYTCAGYCTIKLTSTSTDKSEKVVHEFNFIWQDFKTTRA